MLYRFREAQAAELGLGTRGDRRPKMASACKSLRECERWRGEILREISRKVSKIQDGVFRVAAVTTFRWLCLTAGLTDYEVRDLNDDINKLLREKRHWENQIVALGGANYRRNVAMLDDDGKEVPGTKGYKYVVIGRLFLICFWLFFQIFWSSERPARSSWAFSGPKGGGGRRKPNVCLLQKVPEPRACILWRPWRQWPEPVAPWKAGRSGRCVSIVVSSCILSCLPTFRDQIGKKHSQMFAKPSDFPQIHLPRQFLGKPLNLPLHNLQWYRKPPASEKRPMEKVMLRWTVPEMTTSGRKPRASQIL